MTDEGPLNLSTLLASTGGSGLHWEHSAQIASAICAALATQTGPPVHITQLSWSNTHRTIHTDGPSSDPLAYGAPEWTEGAQRPVQATYNAAAIIVHLLCGAQPFAAHTAHAQRVRKLLEAPSVFPDGTPDDVQRALRDALSPTPETRPPTPLDLQRRLDATQPERPSASQQSASVAPGTLPGPWKAITTHWHVAVILLTFISLFALLLTTRSNWSTPDASDSPETVVVEAPAAHRPTGAPRGRPPPSRTGHRKHTDTGSEQTRPARSDDLGSPTHQDEAVTTTRTVPDAPAPEGVTMTGGRPMSSSTPMTAVMAESNSTAETGAGPVPVPVPVTPNAPNLRWLRSAMGGGACCGALGMVAVAFLGGALCLQRRMRPPPPGVTFPLTTSPDGLSNAQTPRASAMIRFTPFALGEYQCVGELGEGGMGVVYAAEHLPLQRRCALKVLSPSRSALPILRELFQREAKMAARVNHPNVVTIYDFGEAPGALFYLAMELVEGRSLSAVRRPMSLERVLEITRQLCEGLDAAHAAGVLHRDLKPSNILLSHDHRGNELVKILDFGLARPADPTDSSLMDGFLIGTPEWMSPEQARGEGNLDARSDIFSLGLIVYSLLTGLPAYRDPGQTPLQIVFKRARVAGPPPRPSQLRPALSPKIDAAILRALSPAPSDRPDSALDFYASLVV